MAKRLPRPEPITFEEIAASPSLRGFDEFLRYRPGDANAPDVANPETVPSVSPGDSPSTKPPGGIITPGAKVGEPRVKRIAKHTPGVKVTPGLIVPPGVKIPLNGVSAPFPANDVQQGHTRNEQTIYDALWHGGEPEPADESRLVKGGNRKLAETLGFAHSTVKLALQALIDKLSIEIAQEGNAITQVPRVWRVFSYSRILARRRSANLTWVYRNRQGVSLGPPPTRSTITPGVTVSPGPSDSSGGKAVPLGAVITTMLRGDRRPSAVSEIQPSTASTTSPKPSEALIEATPLFDDDARRQLVAKCRAVASDATEDEVAHFTRMKRAQLLNGKKTVDNVVGLLLTAVPKCFEQFGLQRYREEKAAEEHRIEQIERQRQERTAEQIAEHERILADPLSTDESKTWARECLETLKSL